MTDIPSVVQHLDAGTAAAAALDLTGSDPAGALKAGRSAERVARRAGPPRHWRKQTSPPRL